MAKVFKNAISAKFYDKYMYLIDLFFSEHKMKFQMDLDARKPVFGGLRTTKAQTSLRICAV